MQLSVNTFVSIDGVMQGPGGAEEDTTGGFDRGGWLIPHADADMGEVVDGWFAEADAILLGRTTYDLMHPYWSQVTDPDNTVGIALNSLPKYVVSRSLDNAEWNSTTVLGEDFLDQVRGLKEQPGREIQVHGSWRLAQALHEADLVDVYRLLVFPVAVGTGKRLFDAGSTPATFTLESTSTTAAGATHLVLRPRPFEVAGLTVEDGKEKVVDA